jgi:hypothetical protein
MLARTSQALLRDDLNDLKKVFDCIEGYDFNKNVGMRSLKNLGVWLSLYALTAKGDQENVVNELIEKAGISESAQIIKDLVNKLCTPETLSQIIEDYETSGGRFSIFVTDENRQGLMLATAKEVGLLSLLQERVQIKKNQEEDYCFEMENTIKFAWASFANGHRNEKREWVKGRAQYSSIGLKPFGRQQEMLPYLSANTIDHSIAYTLVTFAGENYHLVTFQTTQKDNSGHDCDSQTHLIEPVNDSARNNLQMHYLDILAQQAQGVSFWDLVNNKKEIAGIPNLKLTERQTRESSESQYHVTLNVNFPELNEPLRTTENRLGVYACFQYKVVGSCTAKTVNYKGQRELQYDKDGGTIVNVESTSWTLQAMPRKLYKLIEVTVNYTTANSYMIVYEGIKQSDYYPFWINHPGKDLKEEFTDRKAYKALTAANSSAIFSRPAPATESASSSVREDKEILSQVKEQDKKRCSIM